MTWVIALLIAAAVLGGALLLNRRAGSDTPGEGPWWQRPRDSVAETFASEPGLSSPVPAPADADTSPVPLPPPPPAAPPNGMAPPEDPGPADSSRSFGADQSDLLHGITSMVRRASDGDIRDVRRCIKTLATASDALGHGVRHLSRRLAEPDKHYGPEIWEPLGQAGAQLGSGALHMGQSDASLVSLLRSTVGELAESPRTAPHHSQLNGPV